MYGKEFIQYSQERDTNLTDYHSANHPLRLYFYSERNKQRLYYMGCIKSLVVRRASFDNRFIICIIKNYSCLSALKAMT